MSHTFYYFAVQRMAKTWAQQTLAIQILNGNCLRMHARIGTTVMFQCVGGGEQTPEPLAPMTAIRWPRLSEKFSSSKRIRMPSWLFDTSSTVISVSAAVGASATAWPAAQVACFSIQHRYSRQEVITLLERKASGLQCAEGLGHICLQGLIHVQGGCWRKRIRHDQAEPSLAYILDRKDGMHFDEPRTLTSGTCGWPSVQAPHSCAK